MIKRQTLLHFPNFTQPFELYTDASNLGISGILTQKEKLVGIFSRQLSDVQRRYTIVERETLAIVKSLKHFKNIIFDSHVTIFTDSANQLFIGDSQFQRHQRWRLLLEEFNYSLQHIAGKSNTAADFLSRDHLHLIQSAQILPWTPEYLSESQRQDQAILRKQKEFQLSQVSQSDIFLFTDVKGRIILPKSCVSTFVNYIHLKLVHPGYQRAYLSIHKFYTAIGL